LLKRLRPRSQERMGPAPEPAQILAAGGDYDGPKGLTRANRLNMFCALSAGCRASLYRTPRRIPNGSKR